MPAPPPTWASWGYPGIDLPSSFHSKEGSDSCIEAITWLQGRPFSDKSKRLIPPQCLEKVILTLGMALRAVKRVQFTDPDDGARAHWPNHVANSPLGFKEFFRLQECTKDFAEFAQSAG